MKRPGVHARRGGEGVRRSSGARRGRSGAHGRLVRQHPGRARDRQEDGDRACDPLRVHRERHRARGRDIAGRREGRTSRSTPPRRSRAARWPRSTGRCRSTSSSRTSIGARRTRGTVVPLFRDLEFPTLLKRVLPAESPAGAAGGFAYETVEDERGLDALLDALRTPEGFAVDLETTSLDPITAEIVGISFSNAGGAGALRAPEPRGRDARPRRGPGPDQAAPRGRDGSQGRAEPQVRLRGAQVQRHRAAAHRVRHDARVVLSWTRRSALTGSRRSPSSVSAGR